MARLDPSQETELPLYRQGADLLRQLPISTDTSMDCQPPGGNKADPQQALIDEIRSWNQQVDNQLKKRTTSPDSTAKANEDNV